MTGVEVTFHVAEPTNPNPASGDQAGFCFSPTNCASPSQTYTHPTDGEGMARAYLKLGRKTSGDYLVQGQPGDLHTYPYPTQAGHLQIWVTVEGSTESTPITYGPGFDEDGYSNLDFYPAAPYSMTLLQSGFGNRGQVFSY